MCTKLTVRRKIINHTWELNADPCFSRNLIHDRKCEISRGIFQNMQISRKIHKEIF